jgi:hypothetical protein
MITTEFLGVLYVFIGSKCFIYMDSEFFVFMISNESIAELGQ